jgi:hypothetical protein
MSAAFGLAWRLLINTFRVKVRGRVKVRVGVRVRLGLGLGLGLRLANNRDDSLNANRIFTKKEPIKYPRDGRPVEYSGLGLGFRVQG